MDVYLTITKAEPVMSLSDGFALAFIGLMCLGSLIALRLAATAGRAIRPNYRRNR